MAPEAVAGLAGAVDDVFGLPLEVERRYRASTAVARRRGPSASASLGIEEAERVEAFDVGTTAADHPDAGLDPAVHAENVRPEGAGDFAGRVRAWTAGARRVSRVLLADFAAALDLPPGWSAPCTDHSLDVLRKNDHAPLDGERVELDGDLIGMGEHTDFGIVMLLRADDVRGLQVLDRDGAWHDVSPLPDALLVNSCDLTARWTNERWRSTLHRVEPPVVDGTIRRRRSAAWFLTGTSTR